MPATLASGATGAAATPAPRPPLRPAGGLAAFFFNDTATTEIYTLSLHDALPICADATPVTPGPRTSSSVANGATRTSLSANARSEEHTSELQSQSNLVCRLLLEKKIELDAVLALCPGLPAHRGIADPFVLRRDAGDSGLWRDGRSRHASSASAASACRRVGGVFF